MWHTSYDIAFPSPHCPHLFVVERPPLVLLSCAPREFFQGTKAGLLLLAARFFCGQPRPVSEPSTEAQLSSALQTWRRLLLVSRVIIRVGAVLSLLSFGIQGWREQHLLREILVCCCTCRQAKVKSAKAPITKTRIIEYVTPDSCARSIFLACFIPTFAHPTSQPATTVPYFLYRLSRGRRKYEVVLPRAAFHGESCEGELHEGSTPDAHGGFLISCFGWSFT